MPQYSMITETGLNEIDNAHPLGQYIEIAYYVPCYDYRIDPHILPTDTTISGTNVWTCTNSADTVPQGEVLWNVSGDFYSLSPEQLYLVRKGTETIGTSGSYVMITNFAHREVFSINRFKSSAISDYYTGDVVSSPGSNGNAWYISNAGYELLSAPTSADGYGPENENRPPSRYLYKGVTYQHVITSANDSRANFKVTMRAEHGQIKFNKVGLYGVKRTADGVIAADPFLFAQVVIPEPQVLYSKDVGSTGKVTEITLDFQIESKTLSAGTFEAVFYSTSGDYWVRTTNEKDGNYGLLYDGSVYITNTLAIDETGGVLGGDEDRSVAKLLVGTYQYVNKPVTSAERNMPQLCLQYVSSQGIESKRIRTTFKTNLSGDCEIDMYGACLSAHPDRYSVIPATDKGYGLGLRGNRWSHLYLSDIFRMYNDPWTDVESASSFSDSYINFNINNKIGHFGNTDLYVGPYYNSSKISMDSSGKKYLNRIQNTYYMRGNISSYTASASDAEGTYRITDDLLVRSLNDAIIVTLSEAYENTFTASEIIERIWQLKDVINPADTLFMIKLKTSEIAKLKEAIDPNNLASGFIRQQIAILEKDIEKLNVQLSEINESISPYLGKDKDILLVSGRHIYTYGNIIPFVNGLNDLGWWDNQFAHVFTENITGWDRDDGKGRQVTFHTNIVPDGIGYSIKENGWENGWDWAEITASQFGREDKYVDRAYLRLIDCKDISLPSEGSIKFNGGVELYKNSITGRITNIGVHNNRVGIIYTDDLVVTNQYKEYTHSDISISTSTSLYGKNYKSPGNGIEFTNIRARVNTLSQTGTIHFTIRIGTVLGNVSQQIGNRGIYDIVKIYYKDIMSILGFNTINIRDTVVFPLEQYIHIFDFGTEPKKTVVPGKLGADLVINDGMWFSVSYNDVSKFTRVKANNGIWLYSEINVILDVTGVVNSSWNG